jgi:type II/III secretion system protein
MKNIDIRIPAFLLALFIACLPLAGQERDEVPLRKEIIKVNYIDVREAFQILQPYMSRRGTIRMLQARNTLILEDQADFVDKVLGILEEIDSPPLNLQFTVDIIEASTEKGESDRRLEADAVIRELRKLVKFETFKLLDTALIKVQDNSRTTQRLGGDGVSLQLSLSPRHLREQDRDAFQVELMLRHYYGYNKEGSPAANTLINTTLSLKAGERQVVGVSKLNGGKQSLILILRGEVLK